MQLSRVRSVLLDVFALAKVKQTLLLLFTMYTAYIVGGGLGKPYERHLVVLTLGFITIAAVTALNMYFDRDIDALMERTRDRPLPAGRLDPLKVFIATVAATIVSVILAWRIINPHFALAIVIGFLFDIVAYTYLLKRRTPLSIIAGAVAGGAPALGGWAAAAGRIDVNALLFSLIVATWVPSHIWFLATYYRDDYRRANVPMLPVVADTPIAVASGIGLGSLVMGYSIVGLWVNNVIGTVSLIVGVIAAIAIFHLAVKYAELGGDPNYSRTAFKKTNMMLGLVFLVMMLEKVVSYIIS
ncbi:heme o synthase [Hyperthermus butylicus]|uniref:Protoheme IX farnesyltransferase n=1 Tax=Hyperthermus butylicus (strain DSM 5456 / JCM 9403 / PLM1-5) TaxID=415426 RepID=COXX_HYPBU|nr:heme o synthase [Hyperthermus butylicus]A2BM25.1 RecName: Full=Protoheme IX farnesyltransferase; AltName: Full=Heme B farnesyltransferase; AltName: Full=Heme O synthase [Hyperthermus butylicus DSM 5456]ABM81036.1 protoheme IX farnesyltransferase [Hyperthermus butylicus DSM 5456]